MPLHRMAGPLTAAAAAVCCAAAAWLVGDRPWPLRLLPAGAALAAVTTAVLLRRWDREAGRRVAEADARRASAEWRADERQAELEEQLDEAREQRRAAERRLRAKRDELAGLRTEHAALLRRYATAETERARALEGRRQLALEAARPSRALTSGAADHRSASGAPTSLTYLQADEALKRLRQNADRQAAAPAPATQPAPATPPATGGGTQQERGEPVPPPASKAPLVPRRSHPPARRPQPGGGFDFFGNRRAPQPTERRGPSEPAEPAGDEEGDPSRPVPTTPPPTRRALSASAGQVIDLSVEDSGALDITELRGAVS